MAKTETNNKSGKTARTPEQRATMRYNLCFFGALLAAFLTFTLLFVAGLLVDKQFPAARIPLGILGFASLAVVLVLGLTPPLRIKRKSKLLNAVSVVDTRVQIENEKKNARSAAEAGDPTAAAAVLRRTIAGAKCWFAVLLLAALLCLSCLTASGRLLSSVNGLAKIAIPIFVIAGGAVLYTFYYRFFAVRAVPWDWSDYSDPAEYPALHALARRAADACGVHGEIRISFMMNSTAGIAQVGKGRRAKFSLQLGAYLLDLLTEDELYTVLLHEFSHVSAESLDSPLNTPFCGLLLFEDGLTRNDCVGSYLTCYHAGVVAYENVKYTLAASEFIERVADRNAAKLGNPAVFASALVKIVLVDRFDLVEEDYLPEDENCWAGEKFPEIFISRFTRRIRRAIADHGERWFSAFRMEKQGRNATHPIVRERLASLGIPLDGVTYDLPDPDDGSAYRTEVNAVIAFLDRRVAEAADDDDFDQKKKRYFTEPTERLKKYEEERADGSPCPPEQYRPVIEDLCALLRFDEAEAFARSILEDESIDEFSKPYPMVWLGVRLLNRDEREGLALTYRGADLNDNGINAAIEAIGSYCCRNGLEEEYAEYTRRAEEWLQHQHDVSSERGELKPSDDLRAETFPPEKLAALLDFMTGTADGKLDAIYLVHKSISDDADGYASIFVLQYAVGATDEEKGGVYDRIFNYLDTLPEDWNYALLDWAPGDVSRALGKVDGSCVWSRDN